MMDGPERNTIKQFAAGDQSLREDALRIFHNTIAHCRVKKVPLPHGDVHFEFMSEIDSPCPDYGLRAMYRKQIINL